MINEIIMNYVKEKFIFNIHILTPVHLNFVSYLFEDVNIRIFNKFKSRHLSYVETSKKTNSIIVLNTINVM